MRIARTAATVGFAAIVIALFPATQQANAAAITGTQPTQSVRSAQVTPQDTPWGPTQHTVSNTAAGATVAPLDTPWG